MKDSPNQTQIHSPASGAGLSALLEGLRLSDGPAFFFVLADPGGSREALIRRLKEALSQEGRKTRVFRLDPRSMPLEEVSKLFQREKEKAVYIVDLQGVEAAAYDPELHPPESPLRREIEAARRLLRELNYRRERFAKRPGPVVFLTDSITLGQVMRHAADLFAVRSGIFDLRPPLPPRADQWMLISETITQDLPGSWARPPEFPLSPEQQEGARRWARHLEEQVKREERRPTPNRARLAVLYRELAELAASLGEWERAVEFGQRTVGALRPLAQAHPEAFRADLAKSLSNLGNMLSALGRREEALQATQEAIHFYRSLAEQHPQAFLPDLAGSLTNLGAVLSALGRREEALQATQEAVHLYRQLAARHPDAFLPNLAMSLTNLGNRLADLGRREEALQAAQEAVHLYRQLAAHHPDAFLPDLAGSLTNLGAMLSALGRHEEALQATQEAVQIRRQLAAQHPQAFLPDLARSLGAYGLVLMSSGRALEARAAFAEGLRKILLLARDLPAPHMDLAAALLRDYLEAWQEAGQEPERELLEEALQRIGSPAASSAASPKANVAALSSGETEPKPRQRPRRRAKRGAPSKGERA